VVIGRRNHAAAQLNAVPVPVLWLPERRRRQSKRGEQHDEPDDPPHHGNYAPRTRPLSRSAVAVATSTGREKR
jgi:hypothetical protein